MQGQPGTLASVSLMTENLIPLNANLSKENWEMLIIRQNSLRNPMLIGPNGWQTSFARTSIRSCIRM